MELGENQTTLPNQELGRPSLSTIDILRQERKVADEDWVKDKFKRVDDYFNNLMPPIDDRKDLFSRSVSPYSCVNWMLGANADFSKKDWFMSGGDSLAREGILKIERKSYHIDGGFIFSYSKEASLDEVKEIVFNDLYTKRGQEFLRIKNTLQGVVRQGEYPIDIFLDPDSEVDKILMSFFGRNFKFEETDQGIQPVLIIEKPPGNDFLETETAEALFTAFDKVDLQLSPDLKREMIMRHDDRYGNSYVTLLREVSKDITRADKERLLNFFKVDGEDSKESKISQISEAISKIEITNDPGANLLIFFLKKILNRSEKTDLPVTSEMVKFKAGACKDVENYYASPMEEGNHSVIEVRGKRFLKEDSSHEDVKTTMINLETIIFNGVPIPPGCLFNSDENFGGNSDGFYLMRPTAFCFSCEYADKLFGEEYRDSMTGRNKKYIFDLFSRLKKTL